MAPKQTLGNPALNLPIIKQRTTVVVEPTSRVNNVYDTAEITTVLTVNNDQPREVEFIIPYITEQFSATMAVISAGDQVFHARPKRVARVSGDLERIKPYLRKLGLSEDSFDTPQELKKVANQFRAATLVIPTGLVTLKLQLSAVVNQITNPDGSTVFAFKAYSPLPVMSIAGGRIPLTLAALFKGDESIKPQVTRFDVTNPYGDGATSNVIQVLSQALGEDVCFYWKWQSDPVVDFEYHY